MIPRVWNLSAVAQRCLATGTAAAPPPRLSSMAARRALNARLVRCRQPADLIGVLCGEARTDAALAHLNDVNLCTSVHRLAKLGAAWDSVPDEIRAALVRRLVGLERTVGRRPS